MNVCLSLFLWIYFQCADKHSKHPHSVQVQHDYDADPRVATKRDEGDGVDYPETEIILPAGEVVDIQALSSRVPDNANHFHFQHHDHWHSKVMILLWL